MPGSAAAAARRLGVGAVERRTGNDGLDDEAPREVAMVLLDHDRKSASSSSKSKALARPDGREPDSEARRTRRVPGRRPRWPRRSITHERTGRFSTVAAMLGKGPRNRIHCA